MQILTPQLAFPALALRRGYFWIVAGFAGSDGTTRRVPHARAQVVRNWSALGVVAGARRFGGAGPDRHALAAGFRPRRAGRGDEPRLSIGARSQVGRGPFVL